MKIRQYVEKDDFELVQSWWVSAGYPPIWKALLPHETTYVLESNGKAVLCACLYLMNSPDACMIENIVSSPEFTGEPRHSAVEQMFLFLEAEAKARGYRTVVIFSPIDKLKSRYVELGFVETASNITTFSKSL